MQITFHYAFWTYIWSMWMINWNYLFHQVFFQGFILTENHHSYWVETEHFWLFRMSLLPYPIMPTLFCFLLTHFHKYHCQREPGARRKGKLKTFNSRRALRVQIFAHKGMGIPPEGSPLLLRWLRITLTSLSTPIREVYVDDCAILRSLRGLWSVYGIPTDFSLRWKGVLFARLIISIYRANHIIYDITHKYILCICENTNVMWMK